MQSLKEWLTPHRLFMMAAALVVVYFSRTIMTILFPFLSALFLAAILEPVIEFLEKKAKFPRSAAALATLTASVLLFGYLVVNVFTKLIAELTDLANLLPQHQATLTRIVTEVLSQFEQFNESLPPIVRSNIQSSFDELIQTVEIASRDLINKGLGLMASLPVILIVTTVIIAAAYFISKDKQLLTATMMRFIPQRWHTQAEDIRGRIAVDLVGFIKGRLLMLVIASAIAAAGLIVIGSRYWLILAILIGVLDNIPVVGPGIIFGPWVAAVFFLGDVNRAIYLTLIYTIIFSVRQFAEPKVMGDSVGIHPLAMLVALYGGIVAFGVLGLFIGPILAIIIKAIYGRPREDASMVQKKDESP